MQLSQADVKLFYKLHPALLFYGNQELEVVKTWHLWMCL